MKQEGVLPPAFLLDLDDTILDDSGNVGRSWREACVDHRSELGGIDPLHLYEAVERTREWFWSDPERHRQGRLDLDVARREVVRLSLARLGNEDAALAVRIADRYRARRELGLQPVPGAIETVRRLRDRGHPLALLTNGNAAGQRSKIAQFHLEELFDAILIEGELGYGKPDDRIYRLALEALGVKAEEAVMVGDNLDWDVGAPQRLGVYGVWIDVRASGLPEEEATRPDLIIRSLAELPATIRR